jgi:hypothetical protein
MARGPMAGVSGPGKFSKRTDGLSFQSPEYGAGVENAANKAGAPLARTPDVRPTSRSEMGMAPSQMEPVTPLYAPSQRPDEPITSGIPMGAGPGPEILGINQPSVDTDEDKQRLLSYLPALEAIAQSPSSSQSFRNYVRLLRSNLL